MRKQNKIPIAVTCSDLHISSKLPVCRSTEFDWQEIQSFYYAQLMAWSVELKVPLLIAGDLFDSWNFNPTVVNQAFHFLDNIKSIYAIPGQHELPNHNLKEIKRSAYYTLVQGKKIHDISNKWVTIGNAPNQFHVLGIPWGYKIDKTKKEYQHFIESEGPKVALIHRYFACSKEDEYPGFEGERLPAWEDEFEDFDFVVIGDNHRPCEIKLGKTQFINNGTFIRRKLNEIPYQPRITVLYSDGSFDSHPLSTVIDRFREVDETVDSAFDFEGLSTALEAMTEQSLDFSESLRRVAEKKETNSAVRTLLLKYIQ